MTKLTKKETAELIEKTIQCEAEGVLNIPRDNLYTEALSVIHKSAKKHGRLIVSGVGKAGDVGRKIVSTMNSTGIHTYFLSPLDAAHGDLGMVGENDVLFLISNSGKTDDILHLIKLARNLHKKMPIIALTGKANSPLAKEADFVLLTGDPKEACPLGFTPTTSVIAMLSVADILTVLSMKMRSFTAKEYSLRHHGGYLGKQAKKKAKK